MSSASMSAPSPVDTYLSVYFYEHESVEKIINRFELYNVSDLANLLGNAQQATLTAFGSEVGSQSLAPLLAQLKDILHDSY